MIELSVSGRRRHESWNAKPLNLARGVRSASRAFRSPRIFPGRDYLVRKLPTLSAKGSKLQFHRHILAMTSADVRDMLDLPTGDGHPRPAKKQKVVEKRPGSDLNQTVL